MAKKFTSETATELATGQPGAVTRDQTSDAEVAKFIDLSFTTMSGIDDTIAILNSRNVDPNTSADELRVIQFEVGDQIAKKARVTAIMNAFMASKRAMRPPSNEMISSAKKLLGILDSLIAVNTTATQVVVTATQLFKIWRGTET